jgi:catechol 2,3-dioxygenase-like lactoylglutathione lyase family enzyme
MSTKKNDAAIIGHVGIEVTNLAESKKFYRAMFNTLGFQVVMDDESAVGFSNGFLQVWLAKPQKARVERKSPVGEEFMVADHLAILVQDRRTVDAVEKEMKKHGFEPLFPCEEHPQFSPGYYAVSFTAPDNYVVEIYTRPTT